MRHTTLARLVGTLAVAGLAVAASPPSARAQGSVLRLEHVMADSSAFNVLATLVVGRTEAVLWDAQYHVADARRMADRIAASGRRLKAIVLSHADHDHTFGAAAIVERFPGTPVYMTAKALEEYRRTSAGQFAAEKARRPELLPDSIVTPTVLPSTTLTVDGERLEIIADVVGDAVGPTNSMLWIPSLRTLLASDVVFDGVHPWMGASDATVRAEWRQTLKRIAELQPAVVVAGHKRTLDSPDTPASVFFMERYLADFDSLRTTLASGPELFEAMRKRYPDLIVAGLLRFSAQVAYRQR